MFRFKRNALDPVLQASMAKIDSALALEAGQDKIDQLSAARKNADKYLGAIARKEGDNALTGLAFAGLGLFSGAMLYGASVPAALVVGVVTGASLSALVVVASVIAIGGVTAGAALLVSGLCSSAKALFNRHRALADQQTIGRRIESEIMGTAFAEKPAAQGPLRFLKALTQRFNHATSPADGYAQLSARVMAPRPASPEAAV
jgi:hypothetical protein